MNKLVRHLVSLLAIVSALGSTGCIKKILLNGQIASTRKAAAAVNTISDYEVANAIAFAGLAKFEGMHFLGPENQDALFMLTKGWAGTSAAFIEDAMERAFDLHGEESELYEYHKARAVAAYSRAIFYGTQLLDLRHPGFKKATRNTETVKAWLANFTDSEVDTPILVWTGQAWLSRTNLLKDDPMVVAELFVGYQMIARALELDPTYNWGLAHTLLGAYHARSAMAELDLSKQHFEKSLKISEGKALLTKFLYGAKYYCTKVDKQNYVKLLTEVIEAGDVLPEQRLQNTIAKRKARRYLGESRLEACGF